MKKEKLSEEDVAILKETINFLEKRCLELQREVDRWKSEKIHYIDRPEPLYIKGVHGQ